MTITMTDVLSILRKVADISLVWLVFYLILKNIRNNVKLSLLFKGVAFVIILKIVSDLCGFTTIGVLLEYIIQWGPIALIVIFQPEIRTILEQLGRSQLLGRHKVLTVDERERMVYEVINAVDYLRKERIGALIVIERDNSLQDYIERSRKIYGDISSDLLISIFFPNNPLHDGGLIIQGDKITSAGAVFPTSDSLKISKRLGTRHRAALGISEETDCLSLVVSEETGRISIAMGGELFYNLTIDEFKLMILEELKPKKELVLDDEEDDLENENNNKEN